MTDPPRPDAVATRAAALLPLLEALERHAGWLPSDRNSLALRAHGRALSTAVAAGTDEWGWIRLIEDDLHRLPGGEIAKMLRRTLTAISTVLGTRADDATGASG